MDLELRPPARRDFGFMETLLSIFLSKAVLSVANHIKNLEGVMSGIRELESGRRNEWKLAALVRLN